MNELELRLHRAQHKLMECLLELGSSLDRNQKHDAGIAFDSGVKLGIEKLQEVGKVLREDYLTPWE